MTETEKKLWLWIQQLSEEMIGLIEDPARRRRGRELIEEIRTALRMLESTHSLPNEGPYASIHKPSKAVAEFLNHSPTGVASINEIIDGVFAGGFNGGSRNEKQVLRIKVAIMNRLTGRGRNHPDFGLRMVDSLTIKENPSALIQLKKRLDAK